jgi:hypothetical protein
MSMWCWAWGHGHIRWRSERRVAKSTPPNTGAVDEEFGRIMSLLADDIPDYQGNDFWRGLCSTIAEEITVLSCARCSRDLGEVTEAERWPDRVVQRPYPARNSATYPDGLSGFEPELVTLGWLRKVAEYLQCQLMGHDTQWNRNIPIRGDDLECRTCGRRFARVTDKQKRVLA